MDVEVFVGKSDRVLVVLENLLDLVALEILIDLFVLVDQVVFVLVEVVVVFVRTEFHQEVVVLVVEDVRVDLDSLDVSLYSLYCLFFVIVDVVHRLLVAVRKMVVDGIRYHLLEFLPNGKC